MEIRRKIPPSLYAPMLPWQIEEQLRRGLMPACFVRRMRVINMLSAVALGKIEERLLSPFNVMDLHHILDRQISQDAIIDQIRNEPLSYALATGDIRPLWEAAGRLPLLRKSFITGWASRFFMAPFDPLCVMLAMKVRVLLDLIDEMGHSFNLQRFFPAEIFEPIAEPDPEVDDPWTEPGIDPGPEIEPEPWTPDGVEPGPDLTPPPGILPDGGGDGGGPEGTTPWGLFIGAQGLGGPVVPGGSTTPPAGEVWTSYFDNTCWEDFGGCTWNGTSWDVVAGESYLWAIGTWFEGYRPTEYRVTFTSAAGVRFVFLMATGWTEDCVQPYVSGTGIPITTNDNNLQAMGFVWDDSLQITNIEFKG